MSYRKIVYLFLAALLAGLTACNPGNVKRNSSLEDTLLHYKIMMNRSNYAAAARFRLPASPWDVSKFGNFQLSHYEVKQSQTKKDGDVLERLILLRYIDRRSMRERSLSYTEKWIYNSDNKQWRLDGKPPVFR